MNANPKDLKFFKEIQMRLPVGSVFPSVTGSAEYKVDQYTKDRNDNQIAIVVSNRGRTRYKLRFDRLFVVHRDFDQIAPDNVSEGIGYRLYLAKSNDTQAETILYSYVCAYRRLKFGQANHKPVRSQLRPTADPDELHELTRRASKLPSLRRPRGRRKPERVGQEGFTFKRDPLVQAYAIKRAGECCELCKLSPFQNQAGDPFLEVHHIRPLSRSGEDTPRNTAALCPNCHRECHHGKRAPILKRRLMSMRRSE